MLATPTLALLSMLTPFLGMVISPILGVISPRARTWSAVAFGFLTAIFVSMLVGRIGKGVPTYEWIPMEKISIGVHLDALGVYIAFIAGTIGALVLLYSVKYMEHAAEEGYSLSRYYSLVLLFIGSMIGLALTGNLLVLYIFWELVGFCSYALIAYYYKEPKAVWAGTKAFIVTRIGDIGLLIGVIVLWRATGTLTITEIIETAKAGEIPATTLAIAGAGFILGAIGKSAQMPLHVWLPDAMEAPTTISALIHAATMVNAGIYLIARSYPIFTATPVMGWWVLAVVWIGAITALFTAILALVEVDIKRVLAYSTISQLGYMLSAIGFGAILASQFHLMSHAIFKALLFLCAGAVIHRLGTRNMYEIAGRASAMRITHATFFIGTLALMGIPILNGFWSKDMILEEALHKGFYGPFAVLALAAVMTALYSCRMYWLVFRGEPGDVREAPWQMTTPLVILGFFSVVSWLSIGGYARIMAGSMPLYHIHEKSLRSLVVDTVTSPAISVTIIVLLIAFYALLAYRERFFSLMVEETPHVSLARRGYRFDDLYGRLTEGFKGVCTLSRRLQTGDANLNMLGVLIGFWLWLILLFILNLGGASG
ncbi:MAG: hypothetical protein DRO11_04275 [Methanobacteriota archaeon]|nr:MAG: hypothetical protein DRO11_04275 [Euryarchaeota archaeon]